MIQALGEYVVSLTAAAILSSILLRIFPDGAVRSLLSLCCGIFLTVTVLSPLPGLELPDWSSFGAGYFEEGQALAAQAELDAQQQRMEGIKQALEAYILDKADSLDAVIQPQVQLAPDGSPWAVAVYGSWTADTRRQLSAVITNDLGIPEEDQQWNARNGPSESQKQLENTDGPP